MKNNQDVARLPNIYGYMKSYLPWNSLQIYLTYQSRPSKSPSPLMADVLNIAHWRFLILCNSRASVTAASSRAPGRSCMAEKDTFKTNWKIKFSNFKVQFYPECILQGMQWMHIITWVMSTNWITLVLFHLAKISTNNNSSLTLYSFLLIPHVGIWKSNK